jgi:hypothetical protein
MHVRYVEYNVKFLTSSLQHLAEIYHDIMLPIFYFLLLERCSLQIICIAIRLVLNGYTIFFIKTVVAAIVW